MQKRVQAPLEWLKGEHDNMLMTLCAWAEINSGSYHLAGLKKMHESLEEAFSVLDGDMLSIKTKPISAISLDGQQEKIITGDVLHLKKHSNAPFQVLLTGHMDTVFGKDAPFQKATFLDDNTLNGPGVADMKGGLLVMLYALRALEQSDYQGKIGFEVLINADEEIGSPASSLILAERAKQKDMALVYEPAMNVAGLFAGARKGSGKFTLLAQGVAAHAGRDFAKGKNAICFLAEAVVAVNQLNGLREGVTVNVGLMKGGEALNKVPDTAVAKIDVRIKKTEDTSWFLEKMESIVTKFNAYEGYQLSLSGGFGRPPKPLDDKSVALFKKVRKVAKALGLTVEWEASGGCCDGNNLAAEGLAVVDTLGVRGANIHTDKEIMKVDSLVERAQLSALLLMTLAEEGLKA